MHLIYCDESCHLENDSSNIMVLGSITCPESLKEDIFRDIRSIKVKHNLSTWTEIKWTKVSNSKIEFFKELIGYFFEKKGLSFRAVIATGKKQLDHNQYNNNKYDDWYYKMYYQLLNPLIEDNSRYRIFIDVKDTLGGSKVKKLHEILSYNIYDFNQDIIKDIRLVHSNESEIMQLADLFIGALAFYHRGFYDDGQKSQAKKAIVSEIMRISGSNLNSSTNKYEEKFNLFIWQPRGTY